MIEAHCEYRQPARYDDELEVRAQGRLVSPVRIEFTYELIRLSDGTALATGRTVHVGLDRDGRPCRLPPRVRAIFDGAGRRRSLTHERAGHRRRRLHRIDARRAALRRRRRRRRASIASPTTIHARLKERNLAGLRGQPRLPLRRVVDPGRRPGVVARRPDACVSPRGAGRRAEELGTRFQRLYREQHRGDPGVAGGVHASSRSNGWCMPRARRCTATMWRCRCGRMRCRSRSRPTACRSWPPSSSATCIT